MIIALAHKSSSGEDEVILIIELEFVDVEDRLAAAGKILAKNAGKETYSHIGRYSVPPIFDRYFKMDVAVGRFGQPNNVSIRPRQKARNCGFSFGWKK